MIAARASVRWGPWAALALPLLLAATSVIVVARTYSPVPFQDHWDAVAWWRDVLRDGLTLGALTLPHNEHRILFPRLVFLADFNGFDGRGLLNLAVIGVTQAAGALLFLQAGLRRGGPLPVLGAAAAAALIVSLVQWENFFWGFQVQFVAVYAAAAWSIYLFSLSGGQGRPAALIGAGVLLIVAAFCMANGVLAGAAMGLAAIVARRGVATALVAFAVTALLAGVYLYGLDAAASRGAALRNPAGVATYVLAYLGNPWSLGGAATAMAAGLTGAVLTGLMVLVVAGDESRDPLLAAMLGIALFVGLSAGVTALGRLGMGEDQALVSRYATAGAYFWSAHALFWSVHAQRRVGGAVKAAAAVALTAALVFLVLLQLVMLPGPMDVERRVAYGASALLGRVDDPRAIAGLYPRPERVRELAPFLERRRASLFATESGHPAGTVFRATTLAPARCRGGVELWEPGPGGTARVLGRGQDLQTGVAFRRVVLVDAAGRVLGEGVGGLAGPRIRNILFQPHDLWVASVAAGGLGPVTAYGLRADGAACALGQREPPP